MIKNHQSIIRMEKELINPEYGPISPAISVVIMQDQEIQYERYFGWQDRTLGLALANDTLYNIGSISKLYVTVCILKLCGQNRLHLDTPVVQVMPEFKMADTRYVDITVRMLLDHSSGLPGGNYDNWFLYGKDTNTCCLDKLLAYLAKEQLKAAPGNFSIYCNEGFLLAQRVVELISGLDYSSYLHSEVLQPLGLSNTFLSCESSLQGMHACSYNDEGSPLVREVITRGATGTGGLCCTAHDLAAFGCRVFDPSYGVMSKEMIALFSQECANTHLGRLSPFNGLGWDYVGYRYGNRNVLTKGGGTTQYQSQLISIPEAGLSLAGLSVAPSRINGILEQLAYDMLVEKGLLKESTIVVPVNSLSKKDTCPADVFEEKEPLQPSGKYCVLGGPVMLDVSLDETGLHIRPNLLSAVQNLDGSKPYTMRDDGFFWLESADGLRREGFSAMDLAGGVFLIQRVATKAFQYDVAYAQRIEPGMSCPEWSDRNGSTWLKTGSLSNAISLPMEDVVILNIPDSPEGHALFLRDTPHRIVSPDSAMASTPTERDCGSLHIAGNKLTKLGVNYISADTVPVLHSASDLYNQSSTSLWFRVDSEFPLDRAATRTIAYGQMGNLLWDSLIQPCGIVPAGGYLLVFGPVEKDDDPTTMPIKK